MFIFILLSLFSSVVRLTYAEDFSNPITIYQINANDKLEIFSPIMGNAPFQQIQFSQIEQICKPTKSIKIYKNSYDKIKYRRYICDTNYYAIKNEDYLIAKKLQDLHNQIKTPTQTPKLPDDNKAMLTLFGNLKLTPVKKTNNHGNYAFSLQNTPTILKKHSPFKIVNAINGSTNQKYLVLTVPNTKQEFVVTEDEFNRAVEGIDKIYAPLIGHPVRKKNTPGLSYEYVKDLQPIIIPSDSEVKIGASLENGKYLTLNIHNAKNADPTEYVVLKSDYEQSLQGLIIIDEPITVSPVVRKKDTYSFTDKNDNIILPKKSTIIIKETLKINNFQNYLVLSIPGRANDFIISEDELYESLLPTPKPMVSSQSPATPITIYADKTKLIDNTKIEIAQANKKIKFTLPKRNQHEKYPILRDGSNLKLEIPPAPKGPYQEINDTANHVNSSLNKVSKLYYHLLQDTTQKYSTLLKSTDTDYLLKTPYGRCVSASIKNPPGGWNFFYCDSPSAKPLIDQKRPSFTKELRATIAAELIMIHKCLPLQDMEMLPVFFHESRFMPNAISNMDAIGIGQIRPAAIKDVESQMLPMIKDLISDKIPGCEYLLDLKKGSPTNYKSAKSCAQQFDPYYIRHSIVYSSLYYLHLKSKAIKRVNERYKGVNTPDETINLCVINDARLCYNQGPTAVNKLHKFLIEAKIMPEELSPEGNHRDYYERIRSEEAAQYVPKQIKDQRIMEKTAQTSCGPHPKN